ncbi:MAG TPA: tetratricopeptide repeat protein [Nitrospiraceae bacterium]|nr:tetratricopeptide repeat protein [Nitrospiraceae bacterium]
MLSRAKITVALLWALMPVLLLAPGCASEENIRKSKGYYQEGLARLGTDQQQAYVSFQKAVQLNPDNKEAHYGLGHVYAIQGKSKQAEEEFREAIRIDPDYSEAHTYLGQVLANQEEWKDAITSFRRALSNPLYATPDLARFHLGRAMLHEGDPQGAMEVLEDALTVNPPNIPQARLQLELGRVYHQLGFDVRAREALMKASTLDKDGEYAAAAKELLARIKP